MVLANSNLPTPSCPAAETLEAFHLGKLAEDALESMAAHIAACPRCSCALETLQREQTSDRLLGRLRQCQAAPVTVAEAGCARLEAAARAMPLAAKPPGMATLAESLSVPRVAPDSTPGTVDAPVPRARSWPVTIGAYEVLAQIGEGGMGVVYKARQLPLKRLVALKMISAGAHAGKQARTRFRIEGEAVARLRHPHVVQIYELSEHEGLPFYSMELLEGGCLADRLSQGPLPVVHAAELVQKLAAAVHYAHQEQVVHRDLKPGNILLTETGEPKIADFGLAKLLDSDDGHTRSEMALGTPSYMAPEQAAGHSATVGPAVDVYALGAILYQTLTGKPPFKGADRAETLRQVRELEPVPPSRYRAEVPRELEAICLKCLAKTPAKRYASAQALADDLGRWRRGEPTVARPPRWPAWLRRWLRRAAVLLGILAVPAAAVLAVLYMRDPQRILEQFDRELAQGHPVTLLGTTGPPRWQRWRAGAAQSLLASAEDGSCAISSFSEMCLLELLPEVPCDSYRLTAQVRQLKNEPSGRCGLYCAHQAWAGPGLDIHLYLLLRFNGLGQPGRNNTSWLEVRLSGNRVDTPAFDSGTKCAAGPRFPPNQRPGAWHTLELTVRPGLVQAAWDRQLFDLDLPAAQYTAQVADLVKDQARLTPQYAGLLPAPPADLPSRGGLGLYVHSGTATFKEVIVTPLDVAP
jgi:serine/threonine-protein kinase